MKLLTFRIKRAPQFSFLLPPDADDRCGLYIHLPEGHPFNATCRNLHDPAFTNHHDGFPTDYGKATKATFTAWWGTAMGQKGLLNKIWYGAQAAIGGIIIYTAGPVVWVIGGGDGR